jgi:hypothetical protein
MLFMFRYLCFESTPSLLCGSNNITLCNIHVVTLEAMTQSSKLKQLKFQNLLTPMLHE